LCASRFTSAWRAGRRWWCASLPTSQAARTFGASRWHLISWHILRNALPPLIVQASLDIGSAILMAATLGFIGLARSSPPPNGGDGGRWP
jgi:ABC-type microcin C transport system permease subunit YejE